ncbi:restriction endonuclease [Streptomyces sp. NBC_00887]|uniref:restriction endonuclease n=1 Tax=Streptomyces sp. NBC_00887 TaxID=2975859 RepID=UPI0038694429|nr:restriction endonuclease [Streptomyces sp. NBC_00887]
MPIQVGGRVRRDRRSEFNVRRTAFGFLLVAVLVSGAGLTLRTALESAPRHPVAAVFSVVAVVSGAVALLRRRRNRRVAARAASAALDAAYEVVDTALEDRSVAGPEPVLRPEPVDWEGMDPYDFEEAVAALCRRDGCTDAEVVGGAGDLGADVVGTTPDGRRLVVQCKRYTAENKVGSQDLQRFGGTCYAVHEAGTAVVVTTGEFTEPARRYAEQCGIVCVDLAGLTAWSEYGAPLPWHAGEAVQPAES